MFLGYAVMYPFSSEMYGTCNVISQIECCVILR